jgi:hypothetical protein
MTIIEKRKAELVAIKADQERLIAEKAFFDEHASVVQSSEIQERMKKIVPQNELIEYEHRLNGIYEKYIKPYRLNWYYPGDELAKKIMIEARGDISRTEQSIRSVRCTTPRIIKIKKGTNFFEGLPVSEYGSTFLPCFVFGASGGITFDYGQGQLVSNKGNKRHYNATYFEIGQNVNGIPITKHGFYVSDDTSVLDADEEMEVLMMFHNIDTQSELRFSNDKQEFELQTTVQELWAYVPQYIDEPI